MTASLSGPYVQFLITVKQVSVGLSAIHEPPERGSEGEAVADLSGTDEQLDIFDWEPCDTFRFAGIAGIANLRRTSSGQNLESQVRYAIRGVVTEQMSNAEWLPSGFFEHLAVGRVGHLLTCLNPTGGNLPSPRARDKAVSPDQQDAAVDIVDHGAGRGSRVPQHVVVEARPAWDLDVDQVQRYPRRLVDAPLAMLNPLHGWTVVGRGRAVASVSVRRFGRSPTPVRALRSVAAGWLLMIQLDEVPRDPRGNLRYIEVGCGD
jgi:hypothetical protein